MNTASTASTLTAQHRRPELLLSDDQLQLLLHMKKCAQKLQHLQRWALLPKHKKKRFPPALLKRVIRSTKKLIPLRTVSTREVPPKSPSQGIKLAAELFYGSVVLRYSRRELAGHEEIVETLDGIHKYVLELAMAHFMGWATPSKQESAVFAGAQWLATYLISLLQLPDPSQANNVDQFIPLTQGENHVRVA